MGGLCRIWRSIVRVRDDVKDFVPFRSIVEYWR